MNFISVGLISVQLGDVKTDKGSPPEPVGNSDRIGGEEFRL